MNESILFLLGAGFNKDAKFEIGPIFKPNMYGTECEVEVDYPLVSDLIQKCFKIENIESCTSIEELFDNSIKKKKYRPLEILSEEIMKADYYLAQRISDSKNYPDNCYLNFIREFSDSTFITFNYDSLVEAILFKLNRWYPQDGYGVPVKVEIGDRNKSFRKKKSRNLVLHLHGSFCINTAELDHKKNNVIENFQWIKHKKEPEYMFDPESITNLFIPYDSCYPSAGNSERIERRIIAPVPDKAKGLKKKFINQVYKRALKLMEKSKILISIGYSFNLYDRISFEILLRKFIDIGGNSFIIVDPCAISIYEKIKCEFPNIKFIPIVSSFKSWVNSNYTGIDV